MLDLESRMEIFGVTVFRDADDPNAFYHLPGPPRVSRDAAGPMFDLFSYRKGGETGSTKAGGFLNMTVDVGIGRLADRIVGRLKEQFGDEVTLTTVPFSKGSVRVIALGEDTTSGGVAAPGEGGAGAGPAAVAAGPRFVENILAAAMPSLDTDNRAIFSLSLSEDGAAFMLGVLGSAPDARPVGVVYDLEYVGLLPAYDLEITIDFKSVYDYMQSRFNLATLFFKADVDNIIEQMRRDERIRIKETARTLELSTPEAIAARQARIDQVVKDLCSGALFQPSLTPGQPKATGSTLTATDPTSSVPGITATAGSAAASGMASDVSGGTIGGMADAFRGATAAGPTPEGSGTAGDPGTGGDTGTGSGAGSGTGSGSGTGAGSGTGSGGGQGGAVGLWNSLGRPQAAYSMRRIRQEEQRTVTYHLTQTTAQKQTVAPQGFLTMLAGPGELERRVHVIDLNHPFFQRVKVNVNASDVDFEACGLAQMTVELRYGVRPDGTGPKDTASVILRSPSDQLDVEFFVDRTGELSYEYRLVIDYRANFGIGVRDTHVVGPWTRSELRSLSVDPGWLGVMLPVTVQLAPNVPADLVEAQVTVRYLRPDAGVDDSALLVLTPTARSTRAALRVLAPEDPVRFTTRAFYADGAVEDLPEVLLPDPSGGEADDALVIDVPKAGLFSGDISIVDATAELNSVVVDLELSQHGSVIDARTIDMTPGSARAPISIRLPDRGAPVALRYRERRFFRDGGLEILAWQETDTPNIVVGVPADRVLTVSVNYVGPAPSALGLDAILLDLSYTDPGGNPEFDQQESMLITDDLASHQQEWKVRLVDRSARSYTWSLRLLHREGIETTTPPVTEERNRLVVRAPAI